MRQQLNVDIPVEGDNAKDSQKATCCSYTDLRGHSSQTLKKQWCSCSSTYEQRLCLLVLVLSDFSSFGILDIHLTGYSLIIVNKKDPHFLKLSLHFNDLHFHQRKKIWVFNIWSKLFPKHLKTWRCVKTAAKTKQSRICHRVNINESHHSLSPCLMIYKYSHYTVCVAPIIAWRDDNTSG